MNEFKHKNLNGHLEKVGEFELKHSNSFKRSIFKKLQDRKEHRKKVFIYKSLISLLAFFLVSTVTFNHSRTNDKVFIAKVNDILAIKLESELSVKQKLYRTEVILPDGVYFYSESLPEIAELRKININTSEVVDGRYLSIALLAGDPGSKTVEIRHYGFDNNLVEIEKKKLFFHDKE
jgi:hypothetical protein